MYTAAGNEVKQVVGQTRQLMESKKKKKKKKNGALPPWECDRCYIGPFKKQRDSEHRGPM